MYLTPATLVSTQKMLTSAKHQAQLAIYSKMFLSVCSAAVIRSMRLLSSTFWMTARARELARGTYSIVQSVTDAWLRSLS